MESFSTVKHGLLFAEVSGKEGTNIDYAFQKLVQGKRRLASMCICKIQQLISDHLCRGI